MTMSLGKFIPVTATAIMMPSLVLAAGGGESKGGLPQLDITTWPTQIFWLIVTFAVAYILMSRLVTPKIGDVLDKRSATISADLDSAKQADAEAKSTFEAFEKSLADARDAAASMAEAKANAEAAEADLAKKLSKKIKTAETKLSAMREEAMGNLEEVASDAAAQAVAQLTGIKATKAMLNKHVKKAASTIAPQEAN